MSNKVELTVWPWRERMAAETAPKTPVAPWKAAVRQSLIMVLIGVALYAWLGHKVMGYIVWTLAAVVLVSGLFIPPAFATIERFGQWLGKWVGEGLTWGLLAPFFYLCFCPMRLGLILKGKDPLQRRLHTGEPTYWIDRKPVVDVSQYRKQF